MKNEKENSTSTDDSISDELTKNNNESWEKGERKEKEGRRNLRENDGNGKETLSCFVFLILLLAKVIEHSC